ncbi:hypothetical protein ACFYPN_16350 [Streptomyces sp. NPDC005576]|uniref:hypothetical protein n=1 Tax=Streptomyces sp. NPDC005576 TaxID=3364726 RepID=UPI0036836029
MRSRTAVAAALFLVVALAGCGGKSDTASSPTASKEATVAASTPAAEVDCSDTSLSQADWMKSCSEDADGTGGDGGPSANLAFGKPYAWPDGLEVTVLDATVFSDWSEYEEPDPKSTEFRVRLRLDNKSKAPVDLSDITIMVDGATNGGQSFSSAFERGSAPLEGRLAPGVSAVKTDDNALETRYGRDVVVTVQRTSDDGIDVFPEFTGTIR